MRYDPSKIEKKWQAYWAKNPKLFAADDKSEKEKAYILDMFPYPSADGLHSGHVESYTATDIVARYLRMKGKNVLHPQGWDAFGLPAENFAIKTKTHPAITTQRAIANFKKQMNMLGLSYDWSREVDSSDPKYYKWTQWFFLLLYKNGLAYRGKAKVNWCPKCQTVLANEQAEGGVCERCGTQVIQKDLEQWFFKITDFLEDRGKTSGLISGLNKIDWPEHTKKAQKNWIGKSEGAQFEMEIIVSTTSASGHPSSAEEGKKGEVLDYIEVFTTRLDTVFGMTYAVIAPEHPIIEKLKAQISNAKEVEEYIVAAKKKTELQRMTDEKEKTGVELKGVKLINPFNNEAIPVFVGDYVLGHYGTGAIMAVPAHDERDLDFAKKHNLKITEVIKSVDGQSSIEKEAFVEDGKLINSGEFNGLTSEQAREKLSEWLEEKGIGSRKINYKMRDWLVSRQRYWGAPIPIIYCDKCAAKKEQVLILHGWDANSQSDFFPELKKNLEDKGYEVFIFDAPNTNKPDFDEWYSFISRKIKENKFSNFHLIGHSLGGHLAAKIAGEYKLRSLTLVAPAGFKSSEAYFEQFKNVQSGEELNIWKKFQDRALNVKKVKKNAGRINIVFGAKDRWITGEVRQFYIKNFVDIAKINVLDEYGHMSGDEGTRKVSFIENLFGDSQPGLNPVPEKDLPVELPTDVDFMPTGESPLAKSKKFQNVKCPICGAKARRESDTMDTFVCSSWYYFRYADPKNKKAFAAKDKIKQWLPVDLYVGGAEHTVLHLLYARFFTKVLHHLGYIDFDEPFLKLRHQGIILGEDGQKMSKSIGNVVNPDNVVAQYGADSLRMFEMFMGPLEEMKPWNTQGIIGVYRFLERVWNLKFKVESEKSKLPASPEHQRGEQVKSQNLLHKTIKKVSEDIEGLRFNTAISAMMILVNEMAKEEKLAKDDFGILLKLLSPFAPHIAEELWSQLSHPSASLRASNKSIFAEKWSEYDPALVKDETIELIIQVNGKVRDKIEVSADITEADAKTQALASEKIKSVLGGKESKKVIFVKGRLINIVI